jgi:hypothetical protein
MQRLADWRRVSWRWALGRHQPSWMADERRLASGGGRSDFHPPDLMPASHCLALMNTRTVSRAESASALRHSVQQQGRPDGCIVEGHFEDQNGTSKRCHNWIICVRSTTLPAQPSAAAIRHAGDPRHNRYGVSSLSVMTLCGELVTRWREQPSTPDPGQRLDVAA